MGKSTGFIEFPRTQPQSGDTAQRTTCWTEFHESLSDKVLNEQAARCMNCGTPFCHAGTIDKGITSGCPINNLIPDWNDLVYQDQWADAYAALSSTNNFPEFTSRVCPAPCESSCVLGIIDDPVAIKEIEYSIIERAFAEGLVSPRIPKIRTGRCVAVIGSGPAGLACADELNQQGHLVTVFERDDRIGGLLMYGIPNMKLDKTIVQRRIDLLVEEGIQMSTATYFDPPTLKHDFDAVVLCTGATKPRDLRIPGRELVGIDFAMTYLTAATRKLISPHDEREFIDSREKNVIVIGGGDTGTDCVATAIRQGCSSVVQFELAARPPLRQGNHDGWLKTVRTFQTDYGHEEAVQIFGSDPREYCLSTTRFVSDDSGGVKGIETVEVEWENEVPTEVANSSKVWKADLVFLAMGFAGTEKTVLYEELGVVLTDAGTIKVDSNQQTNMPGIFAAGDCSRGQSLVVWAMADGRKAAAGVDKFLGSSSTGLSSGQ